MEFSECVDFRSEETKIYYDAYAATAARPIKGRTKTEYWKIIGAVCKDVGKDFPDITEENAASWQRNMADRVRRGELAMPTLKLRISCCDNFAAYLESTGVIAENPFAQLDRPVVDDTPFSDKIPRAIECDSILAAAEGEGMDMFLIIALVLRMGLTNGDICELKTGNVKHFEDNVVIYFYSDSGQKRYLVVPDDLKDMLSNFHKFVTTEYLFANRKGQQLSSPALMKRVRKVMAKAGVSYSLKDLRNRAIYQMVGAGADTAEIAQYANITMQRVHTFEESPLAASAMLHSCPANLSHLKIAEIN